jgi:hypothetical protein
MDRRFSLHSGGVVNGNAERATEAGQSRLHLTFVLGERLKGEDGPRSTGHGTIREPQRAKGTEFHWMTAVRSRESEASELKTSSDKCPRHSLTRTNVRSRFQSRQMSEAQPDSDICPKPIPKQTNVRSPFQGRQMSNRGVGGLTSAISSGASNVSRRNCRTPRVWATA